MKALPTNPASFARCRICSAARPAHDNICDQCRTWHAIAHTVEHLAKLMRQVRR